MADPGGWRYGPAAISPAGLDQHPLLGPSETLVETIGIHVLSLDPAEAFVFGDDGDLDRAANRLGEKHGETDEADRRLDEKARQIDRVLNRHGRNRKRRVEIIGQVRLQFPGTLG